MAITMIEKQKCVCVNERMPDIVQSLLMGLFVCVGKYVSSVWGIYGLGVYL